LGPAFSSKFYNFLAIIVVCPVLRICGYLQGFAVLMILIGYMVVAHDQSRFHTHYWLKKAISDGVYQIKKLILYNLASKRLFTQQIVQKVLYSSNLLSTRKLSYLCVMGFVLCVSHYPILTRSFRWVVCMWTGWLLIDFNLSPCGIKESKSE